MSPTQIKNGLPIIKTTSKKAQLENKCIEWSLLTTFHCYPKIFQYKNASIRLMWALLFVVFACLTFWLVIRCIDDYLEYGVNTSIRVHNELATSFPTVTICNGNSLSTKAAYDLIHKFSYEIKNLTSNYKLNTMNSALDLTEKFKTTGMVKSFYLNESEKKLLGFTSDIFQTCYFDGVECTPDEDFNWFFSYARGNCFQFNSGVNMSGHRIPLKKTILEGREYGLKLLIGPLSNANKYSTFYARGLKVFIHNSSFLSSTAEEIFLEPGKNTDISLKKILQHKEPAPYSECHELTNFKSDIYDFMKGFEYRQKDCVQLCIQDIINKNCNCFFTKLPVFNNSYLPCFNSFQISCSLKYFYNSSHEIDRICSSKCPKECDYVTYDWSSSSLEYPSQEFFETIQMNSEVYENVSYEAFKKNHLTFCLYYPYKQYTEISETPKISFIDLVSNVGGAMGIFLGFSIFSLVEVFEILFQVLLILFKN